MGALLLSLGNLYRDQTQTEQAIQTYQEAISQFCIEFEDSLGLSNPERGDIGSISPELLLALRFKAEVLHTHYQQSKDSIFLLAALDTYQLLLQVIDQQRQQYKEEGSKLFLLKQAFPCYEGAVEVASLLFTLTDDPTFAAQAFQFMEKSKAVLLFDAVKNSEAKYMARVPDSLLDLENSLRSDIAFYRKQVHKESHKASASDSLLTQYRKHIFQRKRTLQQLTDQLEDQFPYYYQLKYSDRPISLSDIQKHLAKENKLLIEFFVGEKQIYVFHVGSDDIKLYNLLLTEQFDAQLELVLQSLHGSQTTDKALFARASHFLYEQLLAPTLSDAGDQLIIIPDGKLSYLPFEVLLTQPFDSQWSYKDLPYLLSSHSIQYGHSAQLLFHSPLQPIYEKDPPSKWLGYAPSYKGTEKLPYNENEIQRISSLFAGDVKIGVQATVEDFLTHAPSYDLLHLSMHGYPNTEDPMYAYLAFSGDSAKEAQLYAYQLFDMQLDADMVVLSACKTGYGPLARGEGIMSLSRAFRYAGCPSIITSLWRVDGSISQDLLWDFYSLLNEKKPKDVSLREAKLKYLETAPPNRQHPRYWANFVLMGKANTIPTHSWFRWQFIFLLIVPLLIGAWLRHRNNRLPDHTSHL